MNKINNHKLLIYRSFRNLRNKLFSNQLLLFVSLLILQIYSYDVQAIKAYPLKVQYKLPDGSVVSIQLKGDENFKWAVSEDGYTLLYNAEGKLAYAIQDSTNQVVPSLWQLSTTEKRSEALSSFLLLTPQNLKPIIGNELKSAILVQQKARSVSAKTPVVGDQRTLVILMNFKDVQFTGNKADFEALFNRIGYADDNAQGSVRDFYMECSSGQLKLKCDVVGPYTADYNMSYYGANGLKGGNDGKPQELFREAVQAASNEVNFSNFDANKDGCVDNVHIIFAGYGEEAGASSSAIWSHEFTLDDDISIQGMKLNTYSCAPELRGNSGNGISRIGVHCHEMGHVFGAMDFYDADGTDGGEFEGTGEWDIMASGSWNEDGVLPPNFNPYIRVYTFGWAEAKTPKGVATINPANQIDNQVYRLDTSTPGEFFLLENRQQTGFDRALPGHGLIIYHIHSKIDNNSETNTINATNPQMCYPVCASSLYPSPTFQPQSYGEINTSGCPFPGTTIKSAFTIQTIPSAKSWDGKGLNHVITDITENELGDIQMKIDPVNADNNGPIFAEDFETGIFSEHWEKNQTKSSLAWKIFSKSGTNGSLISSSAEFFVEPINGVRYMYLKGYEMMLNNIPAKATIKDIGLKDGENALISFLYQNITTSNLSSGNTLKIYAQQKENDIPILLATLSNTKNEWTSSIINLPNICEDGKVIFEGNVSNGGIYVDDIKVYNSSVTSAAKTLAGNLPRSKCWNYKGGIVVYIETSQPIEIFTLDGRLYRRVEGQQGENRISLPHGFYIVSVKGKSFKVIVLD